MQKMPKISAEARQMLEHYAAVNQQTRAQRKIAAPQEVGIFFVYNGRLFMDSTPLDAAENFGTFKGHGRGHDTYWGSLQRNEMVPEDVEYDEVPRGRVGYELKDGTFHMFLDKCILADRRMVDKIERQLNMPSAKTAPPELDSHYICPGCKKKSPEQIKQEEEDWDF